jgi:ADP-ribosylglycohydrolase
MDVTDRAGGAMLGMAIGEALGAPLEGLTAEQIRERVGRLTGFVDPRRAQPAARTAYFQAGVYEDETQVALAAADVIIRNDGFRPEALRERLAELGQPIDGNAFGAFRRAHRNLRIAVRKMLSGATWEQSGVKTAGSGAASRGVPIGVFYRADQPGRARAAIEAALVTHRDPRSIAACALMAEGIAQALASDPSRLDAAGFVTGLHQGCRAAEDLMAADYARLLAPGFEPFLHQLSDAVLMLDGIASLDVGPALEKIVAHATGKGSRPITLATRGFALTALLTSCYFFLTGFDALEEALVDSVAEGGSTDTIGCLVGGLLGALHGTSGIPDAWRRQLKNAEQVELRGRILGGAPREGLKSLILLEAALTPAAPVHEPKPRGPRPREARRPGPQGRPFGRRPGGAGARPGRGGRPGDGGRPYHAGGRPGGGPRRPGGPGREGRRGDGRGGGPPRGGPAGRGGSGGGPRPPRPGSGGPPRRRPGGPPPRRPGPGGPRGRSG